jgi:hypothetical protein
MKHCCYIQTTEADVSEDMGKEIKSGKKGKGKGIKVH